MGPLRLRGVSRVQQQRFVRAALRERGMVLAVLGPAGAAVALSELQGRGAWWAPWALIGAALLMTVAGALLQPRPRLARATALLAVGAAGAAMHAELTTRPDLVVLFGGGLASLYVFLSFEPFPPHVEGDMPLPGPRQSARIGVGLAAVANIVALLRAGDPTTLVMCGWSSMSALWLVLRWVRRGRASVWLGSLGLGVLLLGALVAILAWPERQVALSAVVVTQLLATLPMRPMGDDEGDSPWTRILEHPARALVVTFALLSAVGAILLALPAFGAGGRSVGLLDAAFTSVSAVCVTGLIVLDTPSAFSPLGHALILSCIQVGGLGIMTFYTVALAALGRRFSLRHESALAGALNVPDRSRIVASVLNVLKVTAAAELLGAALLMQRFMAHGYAFGPALWRGTFTSISAFCNAGFALDDDSLISYQTDPVVLYVVAFLIVTGGLSPAAVLVAPRWLLRKRVPLQSALILATSAALLALGALGYGLMEWTASLDGLRFADRVHNAVFQSAALCTAGFNSVDLSATRPATQALMIALMFIGGSPGGTAGGIKTTTVAVLGLTVIATLRGQTAAMASGRRIGRATVYKAAAVITVAILVAFVVLIALELTQALGAEVALFEVVSALATVGLSLGGTAELDGVGKVIIMICMFAGRVGPLTLFLFVTERRALGAEAVHPEAEVEVG